MGASFSQPDIYCKVDPFTEKQRSKIFCNIKLDYNMKSLFHKFAASYTKYYEDRLLENDKATKKNLDDKDLKKIRSTISVLVITASDFASSILSENGRIEYYNMDAGDLSTAFLIRHLSHYALGIPYDQILITSVEKEKFLFDEGDYEIQDLDTDIPDEKIGKMIYNIDFETFSLFQSINLAQIGDKQVKFSIDESILKEILPFNNSIIKKKLRTNKDSKLFIFILDHSFRGKFSDLSYQYCIKTLNNICCKHFYVFNDSYHSSSMIKLIRKSMQFVELFPNLPDKLSSVFFKCLSKIQISNSKGDIESIIESFIRDETIKNFIKTELVGQNINYQKFNDEIINQLQSASNDTEKKKKIIRLIQTLPDDFACVQCDPKQIALFGSKATVFASSLTNGISLTLPVRRIIAGLKKNYRPCGSIFSSIFIQAFLNGPNTFTKFCDLIKILLPLYKEKFESIIIEQNKKVTDINSSYDPADPNIIKVFFSTEPLDEMHLFSSQGSLNEWPYFRPIIINDIFWNVDLSDVDNREYNNVYLVEIIQDRSKVQEKSTEYGPSVGMSNLKKFSEDFNKVFNSKLKENKVEQTFGLPTTEMTRSQKKSIEKNSKKGLDVWTMFMCKIDPIFCCNLTRGLEEIKYSIFTFFDENEKIDIEKASVWLVDAYKEILPFWKKKRL